MSPCISALLDRTVGARWRRCLRRPAAHHCAPCGAGEHRARGNAAHSSPPTCLHLAPVPAVARDQARYVRSRSGPQLAGGLLSIPEVPVELGWRGHLACLVSTRSAVVTAESRGPA